MKKKSASKKELEAFWKDLQENEDDELLFKPTTIAFCCQSKHAFINSSWVKYENADDIIIQEVLKKIHNPKHIDLEITPVYDELGMKPGLTQDILVEVQTPKQKYDIPVVLTFTICPKVSKRGTTYFEGMLQLRGSDKMIARARELVEKHGAFINKEVKEKEGVDFYVSSKKVVHQVGKALSQEFIGEFAESPQLFSRDAMRSKDLYRVNSYFKEKPWKIGDIIDYNGDKIKINKFGKKLSGKSMTTGKNIFLK